MYQAYIEKTLQEDLKRAVEENIPEKVIELLERIVDRTDHLSAKTIETVLGKSLGDAVKRGNLEIIQSLLQYGADVNYEHVLKQSILCRAIYTRNEGIITYLLDKKADINHRGINGESDFMFLMNRKVFDLGFMTTLLDSVTDIQEVDLRTGGTYLHILAERHHDEKRVEILQKLIEKGVPVNSRDNNDDTPLHRMAEFACLQSMKVLILHGAEITAKNRVGEIVLHTLSSSNEFDGFNESLRYLVDEGLDINCLDGKNRTVVHHALLSKDTKPGAIKQLLSYGLTLNIKDVHGKNEMFYAVQDLDYNYTDSNLDDRIEVINLLAANGADVNAGDCYGRTPLHLAVITDCLDLLVALLDLGADVTKKTKTGATPLHLACKKYNMAHVMIHWYLTNNHNINIQDMYGSTALHWAIWYRQMSVSQSLLQTGGDVNIQDEIGVSPADLARILHLSDFQTLMETYTTLEGQALKEPVFECSGSDQLFACPLLRYVRKSNDELHIDEYEQHVTFHKSSVQECVNSVLRVRHMGLFFDIEENQTVPELIETLMLSLAEKVSNKNSLFRCELSLAGSSFEGTKVYIPDEFDYLWNLMEFSLAFSPIESSTFPDGFVKLRLQDESLRPRVIEYLNEDDYLDCKMLLRHFYRLINEELRALLEQSIDPRFNNIVCLGYLNEISGSLTSLTLQYFGRHAKSFNISIDVVPTVFPRGWKPVECSLDSNTILKRTKDDTTVSVVFKTPDRCHVEHFTLYYRVSFAYLEQRIIRRVPAHIKKGYIILKTLTECGYLPAVVDHDNAKAVKKFITTYYFKTCFLHELEKQAERIFDKHGADDDAVDHSNKASLEWAQQIVDRLEACVQERNLPTFFNQNKNLFSISSLRD